MPQVTTRERTDSQETIHLANNNHHFIKTGFWMHHLNLSSLHKQCGLWKNSSPPSGWNIFWKLWHFCKANRPLFPKDQLLGWKSFIFYKGHPNTTILFCVTLHCPKGCHFHECRFISCNSITSFQRTLSWHCLFVSKSASKQLSLA